MELAGVGDLGVEVGDLGTQAPAWSRHLEEDWVGGEEWVTRSTLKILPGVPWQGYGGAPSGTLKGGILRLLARSSLSYLARELVWFGDF